MHIRLTESRLYKLRSFQLEIDELQSWLSSTKLVLESQHSPSSVTSADGNDSFVVDPQVCDYFANMEGEMGQKLT